MTPENESWQSPDGRYEISPLLYGRARITYWPNRVWEGDQFW